MQRVDRAVGWSIAAVGLIHCLATAASFDRLGPPAMWFLSGGLALLSLGAFNLLRDRYGPVAPGLRSVCIAANVANTAFAITYAAAANPRAGRDPVSLLFIALLASATAISILRRPPAERAATPTPTGLSGRSQ